MVNVYINREKNFAFVEFRTGEAVWKCCGVGSRNKEQHAVPLLCMMSECVPDLPFLASVLLSAQTCRFIFFMGTLPYYTALKKLYGLT